MDWHPGGVESVKQKQAQTGHRLDGLSTIGPVLQMSSHHSINLMYPLVLGKTAQNELELSQYHVALSSCFTHTNDQGLRQSHISMKSL